MSPGFSGQAEIRHQRAGIGKPSEIVQLRQNEHRRQDIDAAEASQPRDPLAIRFRLRRVRQLCIEVHEPTFDLLDRQQVVVDDRAFRDMVPVDRLDPLSMRLDPIASRIVQPAAQEQFAQPMTRALHVVAGIISGPSEVAHRFLGWRRWSDDRQTGRLETTHQFTRIALVGLDAIAGFPRHQRRRNHHATDSPHSSTAAAARSRTGRLRNTPGRASVSRSNLRCSRSIALGSFTTVHVTGVPAVPTSIATWSSRLCRAYLRAETAHASPVRTVY